MRIQGQLDGDILINLLQYLNLNGASGVLRLRTGLGSEGEVFTENGQVVHARTAELSGMKALVQLLRWKQGRFSFEAGTEPADRTIDRPLDALLLEVAYETDVEDLEQEPREEQLDGSTVLMPLSSPSTRRGRDRGVTLPVLALRILPLLDRNLDLNSLARRIRAPLEDVLNAAQVIVDSGLAAPHRSAHVGTDFIHSLTALMRDIIGPLADIVLDEALYDLNLTAGSVPEDQLPELIRVLGEAIEQERRDWRAAFDSQVAALLRRSGLTGRQ